MIVFRFQNGRLEGSLRHPADLLVGIGADLEILVGGRLLFQEPDFPVVELRTALAAWLREEFASGEDFVHVSVEHDEPGLLWIRRSVDGSGWNIGSIWQERVENRTLSDTDVHDAVREFVHAVDRWVKAEFGVDVDRFLTKRRRQRTVPALSRFARRCRARCRPGRTRGGGRPRSSS